MILLVAMSKPTSENVDVANGNGVEANGVDIDSFGVSIEETPPGSSNGHTSSTSVAGKANVSETHVHHDANGTQIITTHTASSRLRSCCCSFGSGVATDFRNRISNWPSYKTDWVDGFRAGLRIFAPATYVFFTSVIPAIAFGEQFKEATDGEYTITHVSTAMFMRS